MATSTTWPRHLLHSVTQEIKLFLFVLTQWGFLCRVINLLAWEVSFLIFHEIVLTVQGTILLLWVHRCLCSFQTCFCFSLGATLTITQELLFQIQLLSMQHIHPRNVLPKAFGFDVCNKSASHFLTSIQILESLFPGDQLPRAGWWQGSLGYWEHNLSMITYLFRQGCISLLEI